MTVKELIIELLTCPMDANVELEVLTDNHCHKYSEAHLGSVVHYREYGVLLEGVEE